jgi:hypothetical protein
VKKRKKENIEGEERERERETYRSARMKIDYQ